MTLSDFGAAVALDALASVLDGGRIELLDADGAVLAAVTLAVPAFRPAEHGEAEAHPMTPDRDARALGEPVAYRTVTLDGKEITAGPVAHQAPGELVFPPELVVPHAEVTIDRFLLRLRGVA
jgi:hypothetical protein